MSRPTVSVLLTSYNQRPYVAAALDSAVAQDYDALEVVVADDGSDDGSYERLVELAARHGDRVRLLPRGVNQGPAGIALNRNRGLRACAGTYIAYLDGDDLFLPGKIASQVAWLDADPRRVLCGHDVEAFDSATGNRLYLWSERFGLASGAGARRAVRGHTPFGASAIMFRASAMPPAGFDPRVMIGHDWLFWIECLAAGGHFGHVPGVLARYRRHPGSWTTMRADLNLQDRLVALALIDAKYPHLRRDCRRGRATVLFAEGMTQLFREHWGEARALFGGARAGDWRLTPKAFAGMAITRLPAPLRSRACRLAWPASERIV